MATLFNPDFVAKADNAAEVVSVTGAIIHHSAAIVAAGILAIVMVALASVTLVGASAFAVARVCGFKRR